MTRLMTPPSVAFFAMPQAGHFENLRPVIAGLARRGLAAYVLTDAAFKAEVEQAGGEFVDLFARYPIDEADAESFPTPCRYVTFAGSYGERIVHDLVDVQPDLVIYDQHAVVGRLVGQALQIPYVSFAPAHHVCATRLPALIDTLPEVTVSESCTRAVATLRERHGVADASPFFFATSHSPFLNLYGEPSVFLTERERPAHEPVAFHGCLPSLDEGVAESRSEPKYFEHAEDKLKVYVSFGTVVWRYFPEQAVEAVRAIARGLAQMADVRAVISLGGSAFAADAAGLKPSANVSFLSYLDQPEILHEADVFVTHNGLRSTHEAIVNRVPMISYPFFWDQPALADRCQDLGLAIPLTSTPLAPVSEANLRAALAELRRRGPALRENLKQARGWELEVIAARDSVLDQIVGLLPEREQATGAL
jgi:MGT family glycosyltransferase